MMPKLSETLPPATELYRCQQCGGVIELARWVEHDEEDKPTHTIVVLCGPCSQRIIEPHPRLYQRLHKWHPWPGAMSICVACVRRSGLRCQCALASANGGSGLKLKFPEPDMAFIDGRDPKTGKRWGRREVYWQGPVTDCAAREASA